MSALLLGCGGGGQTGSEPTAAPQAGKSRALKVPSAHRAGTSAITLPADGVPSDTEDGCTNEDDFFDVASNGSAVLALVNRHVMCIKDKTTDFWVDVTGTDGVVVSDGGRIDIEALWTVYGPSSVLTKNATLQLRYTYRPAPGADPNLPAPVLNMVANVSCTSTDEAIPVNCDQALPVSLSSGSSWTSLNPSLAFNWDSSTQSIVSLRTNMALQFTTDGSTPGDSSVGRTYKYNPSFGISYTPALRCDVGQAKLRTKGCVFADAAAVFVLKDSDNVPQSRQHIADVFATLPDVPGKFELEPGTRAIAKISNLAPSMNALNRLRNPVSAINANRSESNRRCKRDFGPAIDPAPEFCPIVTDPDEDEGPCDCDEYPFASSAQGANSAGGEESKYSVRRIPSSDNRSAGAKLGEFYRKQRVVEGEQFWVAVP